MPTWTANAFLIRGDGLQQVSRTTAAETRKPINIPETLKPCWHLTARDTIGSQISSSTQPCGLRTTVHLILQQSYNKKLVSFASLSAISRTFNPLSKVLFTFPSRYLFAIGLESIFSFRRKLPPILRTSSKVRDSTKTHRTCETTDETGLSPSPALSSKKTCAGVHTGDASQDYNSVQARIYSLSFSRFIRHY